MKVAAVIGIDGNTIVPLPDGPTIRLWDTDTGATSEIPNPAFGKETDRRPTAARALVGVGAQIVITPPGSFCSPSHKIATEAGMRFWPVNRGTRWDDLWQGLAEPPAIALVDRLPTGELMKQNLSSARHYALLGLRGILGRIGGPPTS